MCVLSCFKTGVARPDLEVPEHLGTFKAWRSGGAWGWGASMASVLTHLSHFPLRSCPEASPIPETQAFPAFAVPSVQEALSSDEDVSEWLLPNQVSAQLCLPQGT